MAFLPLRFSGTDREGPEQGRSGGVRFAPARGRDGSGPAFPTGRGEACAGGGLTWPEPGGGSDGPVTTGPSASGKACRQGAAVMGDDAHKKSPCGSPQGRNMVGHQGLEPRTN